MAMIRVIVSRMLDLVLRRRRDDRLDEEIQGHLELLSEEYRARGMTAADARAAARRAFGGVDQMKAMYRDQRGLPVVDAVSQDLRFALRLLHRDRGFALTVVAVLGLGIGVNNMLFTIVNAHTIRGLPIPRPDRVLYVSTVDARNADRGVSYPDFEDVRRAAQSFVGLSAFINAPVAVGGDGRSAERFDGTFVSANAFAVLGVQPILGRAFTAEEDQPGAPAVAVLGSGAWRSRYAGDRAIIGRSILVNGAPATVIGVMADRSGFPSTAQVWLPLWQTPDLASHKRDARTLRVFGRVRDGIATADARAEIHAIIDRLSREHPETNANVRARTVPINDRYLGRLTEPAWLAFMTAGFLVVVISCANVANLMLARSIHRTREIAIRTSLGASRRRVIRQLLIEGAVLAACGGIFGLGAAMSGVRLFRSAIPEDVLPYWLDYSLDGRVLAALVAVSLGTVFIFALMPAIHVSKTDVNQVLKDGGRSGGAGGRAARRWTTAFLTAEFALAVVLLAHVAVSLRLATPPLPSDRVLDTKDVITAAVTLPGDKYRTPDQRAEFYRQLDGRIRAIPAVSSASVASALPLMGAAEARLDLANRPRSDAKSQPFVRTVAIGPRYFETCGLALVRGRDFDEHDGTPGQAHAIVNERFVQQFLGDENAIGERIAVGPPTAANAAPTWLTIIGISQTVRQRPVADPEPIVYLPFRGAPSANAVLLVRSRAETGALARQLREEVLALDAGLPLYRIRTMAQVIRDAQWNGRVAHMLVLVLTFIAATLSTIGLYAVTAHAVGQRTREIGVRMALGARPRQVMRLIIRRAVFQLALGFVTGIVCTTLWDWMFSTGRPGVVATDPQSLLIIAATLTLLAVIACFVPVRRATRLDPVAAIRQE
jgi:putative ABC transport system permease protein